ncbi:MULTISPECIES: AraC family transcriptional regulator [Cytobacillus]|uniref:AraC family transcriptional regulator n=1 Tax=Cytobacillus stercorigallinarum TaxID=2762240 RepID=A0ABR8QRY3_9BACI|nr:AraC family transcriptional regulator [Cytobacillus stercorigallinarum]MBD7938306.1 AraC family transcriptional regulator [Cytobacillus stercorigallinarum]
MNQLKGLNDALAYIEKNLTEEINEKEMARVAGCSVYHFKRTFSFLAGMPLSEYLRKRRLTLAAIDIQDYVNLKVIDIAVKYGYRSADAFSRAFYSFHGVTPSMVRHNEHVLKVFPKMTFQLIIQGGVEMDYHIVKKEAFWIIGLQKRVPIVFKGVNPAITEMWHQLDKKKIQQLLNLSNVEPNGIIQASTNFSEGRMEEKGELDHYIGVASTSNRVEGYSALEVPAMEWAIFETIGPFPQTLQETWGRIYAEWFPSTNYQQLEGPEIVSIQTKDLSADQVKTAIWIPVTQKNSV